MHNLPLYFQAESKAPFLRLLTHQMEWIFIKNFKIPTSKFLNVLIWCTKTIFAVPYLFLTENQILIKQE